VAGTGAIRINELPAERYLSASPALLLAVQAPLRAVDTASFDVEVRVAGGGLTGQAEAIQLGVARALLVINPDHRLALRSQTLLTRDAREKERRKYGLKKARKAPQFSKRSLVRDSGLEFVFQPGEDKELVVLFSGAGFVFFLFQVCLLLPTKS
jgi:small subunit ribosomal protein S9